MIVYLIIGWYLIGVVSDILYERYLFDNDEPRDIKRRHILNALTVGGLLGLISFILFFRNFVVNSSWWSKKVF